jgi:acetyl-CoA carboxylase biotin carboxylase subunit
LLDQRGAFHFIELNPRIQVEHPVTEMVTGVDLVKEQLRLAAGRSLPDLATCVESRGAAIEARVLAEDPSEGFMPTTGEITYLKEPGGPGIRVDSALYQGMKVTPDYDSLLAKVIAWGESRPTARLRLRRALQEFQIGGVVTDLAFLRTILESMPFIRGEVSTTFVDGLPPEAAMGLLEVSEREVAAAAAYLAHRRRSEPQSGPARRADSPWRSVAWREQM